MLRGTGSERPVSSGSSHGCNLGTVKQRLQYRRNYLGHIDSHLSTLFHLFQAANRRRKGITEGCCCRCSFNLGKLLAWLIPGLVIKRREMQDYFPVGSFICVWSGFLCTDSKISTLLHVSPVALGVSSLDVGQNNFRDFTAMQGQEFWDWWGEYGTCTHKGQPTRTVRSRINKFPRSGNLWKLWVGRKITV